MVDRERLVTEHGEDGFRVCESGGRTYVVRRPTRGEYKLFRRALGGERTKDGAAEQLVMDCIVEPSRDEFLTLLEKRPALCEELAEAVLCLAGLTGEAGAGK